MSARKDRPKNQKKIRKSLRFTAADIIRAVDAVERAGLTVHGVEITLDGSIKINTTSPFKRAAASKPETTPDVQADVQPSKKRA
jgi:hypothetical protein